MCNNTQKKKAAGAGKDFTLFFGVMLHFNFKCVVAMTLYDHSDTVPSRKRRTGYMNGWMDEHLANKISIQGNVVEKVNPLFTTLLQD